MSTLFAFLLSVYRYSYLLTCYLLMLSYKYHSMLPGFATQSHHISFGLVTVLSDEDRKALEEKGYPTGKKTIQIKFDQAVPTAEIKRILMAMAEKNEQKSKKGA